MPYALRQRTVLEKVHVNERLACLAQSTGRNVPDLPVPISSFAQAARQRDQCW
jgi:hypothetical protein